MSPLPRIKPLCLPSLDAVLDRSSAPPGNLAAEILPAELRLVPGGGPQASLPHLPPSHLHFLCPPPLPPPPRETVARLQQENQRLQAQEAALRLQRDRLQRQLRDIDR